MEEVFIVQKRPAHAVSNGFYYRIVNTQTGEPLKANFFDQVQAERKCAQLNEEAAQPIAEKNPVIHLGR